MTEKKNRIAQCFSSLHDKGRAGLVTFVTAGDPDHDTARAILDALPDAGADIVELGMPFSDPMADGPSIQASSQRALKGGASMVRTLELARGFRTRHAQTPLILMGYFNPIYRYGAARFCQDAALAGVDGLIIVDLPPEEDQEIMPYARDAGLDMIRLVAPTSDDARLKYILKDAGGFIYYISITGITGTHAPDTMRVQKAIGQLKGKTGLPVAVGFGIKTADQAAAFSDCADAIVVGSALTEIIRKSAEGGLKGETLAGQVASYVSELSAALRNKDATKQRVR